MADTYRSIVVLNKVHKAFFNRDYFIEMTTSANEHLLSQFTLVLENELESTTAP